MKAHTKARKSQLVGTMRYAIPVVSSVDEYVSSLCLMFDDNTKIDIRMTKQEAKRVVDDLLKSIG